ncbi:hypothetical protein [Taibaiella koreensis]|uniref:hypothetical protein n=1 Tax=Taibaiella koreensis TaxID=1268548 RepID=UPI000E5A0CB0|nr:hypothetical protein [Taibaiella koreensis]
MYKDTHSNIFDVYSNEQFLGLLNTMNLMIVKDAQRLDHADWRCLLVDKFRRTGHYISIMNVVLNKMIKNDNKSGADSSSAVSKYFKETDKFIQSVHTEYESNQNRKQILDYFMNSVQAITALESDPRWSELQNVLPYRGNFLHISQKVGKHYASVAITPDDPKEAIVLLSDNDDRSRPLFKEYGGEISAETYVREFYGNDGIYAKHYRQFLDMKERYPNQACTL